MFDRLRQEGGVGFRRLRLLGLERGERLAQVVEGGFLSHDGQAFAAFHGEIGEGFSDVLRRVEERACGFRIAAAGLVVQNGSHPPDGFLALARTVEPAAVPFQGEGVAVEGFLFRDGFLEAFGEGLVFFFGGVLVRVGGGCRLGGQTDQAVELRDDLVDRSGGLRPSARSVVRHLAAGQAHAVQDRPVQIAALGHLLDHRIAKPVKGLDDVALLICDGLEVLVAFDPLVDLLPDIFFLVENPFEFGGEVEGRLVLRRGRFFIEGDEERFQRVDGAFFDGGRGDDLFGVKGVETLAQNAGDTHALDFRERPLEAGGGVFFGAESEDFHGGDPVVELLVDVALLLVLRIDHSFLEFSQPAGCVDGWGELCGGGEVGLLAFEDAAETEGNGGHVAALVILGHEIAEDGENAFLPLECFQQALFAFFVLLGGREEFEDTGHFGVAGLAELFTRAFQSLEFFAHQSVAGVVENDRVDVGDDPLGLLPDVTLGAIAGRDVGVLRGQRRKCRKERSEDDSGQEAECRFHGGWGGG